MHGRRDCGNSRSEATAIRGGAYAELEDFVTEYINVRFPTGRVVHRGTVLARGNVLTHCGHYCSRELATEEAADCEPCAERRERIEDAALVGAGR
jgi:hypothetical protein